MAKKRLPQPPWLLPASICKWKSYFSGGQTFHFTFPNIIFLRLDFHKRTLTQPGAQGQNTHTNSTSPDPCPLSLCTLCSKSRPQMQFWGCNNKPSLRILWQRSWGSARKKHAKAQLLPQWLSILHRTAQCPISLSVPTGTFFFFFAPCFLPFLDAEIMSHTKQRRR